MVLDCSRIYGMYDTGANFSIVIDKLTQVLGLAILLFIKSFTMADGSLGKYARKLGPTRLQFHDKLELAVEMSGYL